VVATARKLAELAAAIAVAVGDGFSSAVAADYLTN
jgi:hypothetical protein